MKFMLDTNTVSYLFRNEDNVVSNLQNHSPHDIVISSITEAELLYGIAKNPQAKLVEVVEYFLKTTHVLPWDRNAAECYGRLKASIMKQGRSISELDLLIVSHALALDLTLVTSDKGLLQLRDLPEFSINLVNWRD